MREYNFNANKIRVIENRDDKTQSQVLQSFNGAGQLLAQSPTEKSFTITGIGIMKVKQGLWVYNTYDLRMSYRSAEDGREQEKCE